GKRAEPADDQAVADERIMVEHAALDEAFRAVRIVVIGELADLDIGLVDQRLEKSDAGVDRSHGVLDMRVGTCHRAHLFWLQSGISGSGSAGKERPRRLTASAAAAKVRGAIRRASVSS